MKLRMKISGSFRSEQGPRDFATLRSALSTAKKQGLNRIQVLLQGPEALQASLKYYPRFPEPAIRSGSTDLPTVTQTLHSRGSVPISRTREPGQLPK